MALWRALHVQVDAKPHVFTDEVGLHLINEKDWRNRPDMDPDFSKGMRASIVGRARFVENLVEEQSKLYATQYVILGAGLDTFAQRRPEIASQMNVFEVDQPGPQEWKQKRLAEIGLATPKWLHFVPVDFEAGQSWWERLIEMGFDPIEPTIVVSTGVSMYLTKKTIFEILSKIAKLASGSIFAMTFMLKIELLDKQEKSVMEIVTKKALQSGTPFISFFSPDEILGLAKQAGFHIAKYISGHDIYMSYFANRTDGLRAGDAEAFLLAMT